MMLEDHAGDIVHKSRQAARVTAAAAAQSAGLSLEEYEAFESTGKCGRQPDYEALAPLLFLHPARLEAIANGWLPTPPEISQWRELRQISTTQGGNTVNAYLVWDEITREAALFDTGWEAGPIFAITDGNDLELHHVFLTHDHEDHVAGLGAIHARFPKARIHSSSAAAPADQRNRANDFIHLGNLRITLRATPGHSPDGVTYMVGNFPEDAPNAAFVGDALFAGSMGRGFESTELLRRSVRQQILTLPEDTLLCPGHGPFTTVGQEKEHNPFFG
jgi:glyoxylase-like metal-dependent hydrolase (beta-lactamase superfamily II)